MSCEFEQSHSSRFSIVLRRVFLICSAGRASVNCQRPRKRAEENIQNALNFRGRTFINGKEAAHPSLPCVAQPKETGDLCREKSATDNGHKAKEGMSKSEHFSLQSCLVVVFGVYAKCLACQNQ